MPITKEEVRTTGKMADMAVSEQEASIYEAQLEALFKWVDELSSVNTDGVKLDQATLGAMLRKDEAKTNSELAKELREDFAQEENGCVKVKKVL